MASRSSGCVPDEVRADDGMQLGLWGGQSEADRQAARAIARLTSLTSDDAVTVPVWRGGRLPADRYGGCRPRWSTSITGRGRCRRPARERTHRPVAGVAAVAVAGDRVRRPASRRGVDGHGEPVRVERPRHVSAPPSVLVLLSGDDATGWRRGRPRPIVAWAGPWPVEERWWEPGQHRRLARFQVVTDDHDGFLVVAEHQRWWISARYD